MLSVRHEVFMEVARQLSFSKASEVLFISQPAVSKHIKALEGGYQVSLFDRHGSAIQLSVAGALLYNRLKTAKKLQDDLEFELSQLNDQLKARGQLKLGASTTVALYLLPKILSAFHQKFPQVKISLLNRNTDTITKALIDQEIDLGIVEGRKKQAQLLYTPFAEDEVVAACSAHSQLAQLQKVSLSDISAYPIVLREQGSGTLAALKSTLEKNGMKLSGLQVQVRLAGTEALKNFLIADTCLGFLPRGAIRKELQTGELIELPIEDFKIVRNFFFIQRHGGESNALSKTFIRFSKKMV